jgi:hypothetical protein
MPSLKKQLANLSATKVEVVNAKTDQKKNLEGLFLEAGFAALSGVTEDGQYPPCECVFCFCTDSCVPVCCK